MVSSRLQAKPKAGTGRPTTQEVLAGGLAPAPFRANGNNRQAVRARCQNCGKPISRMTSEVWLHSETRQRDCFS
jgi:hypothetical protein